MRPQRNQRRNQRRSQFRNNHAAIQKLEQRLCLTPNILISATSNLVDRTVIAVDPSGRELTSWDIPLNDSSDFGGLRGISHSEDGLIYGYNGTHRPCLTVFDPQTTNSEHYSANGLTTIPDVSSGSVAVTADFVFASDMRTGSETNAQAGIVRFDKTDPTNVVRSGVTADGGYKNLTVGLDGFVYAITAGSGAGQDVDVFDPTSMNRVRTIGLEFQDYRGIAVNAGGELFLTTANAQIRHYDGSGRFVNSVTVIPTDAYRIRDIDISADGDIVVGQSDSVVLTTESLTNLKYITVESFYPPFVAFARADIPPATLALSMQRAEMSEGAEMVVTVRRPTTQGITAVELSTDWPDAIDLPNAVAIPNGEREVSFTVSSIEDRFPDPDKLVTLTAAAVGFESSVSQFTVTEDDSNQILIRPVDLTVTEGGEIQASVRLAGAPRTDVVVQLTSQDEGEFVISPATLTFTTDTWNFNQAVTITGVADTTTDGDQTAQLTATIDDDQSDDSFDSAPDATPDVLVIDIDQPGLITNRLATVEENGDSVQIPVKLTVAPATDVVVTVGIGQPTQLNADVTQLTFTPENWDTSQFITLSAIDDAVVESDQRLTVTLAIDDAQSDDEYKPVSDTELQIDVVSDDVAGLAISQTDGTTIVSEDGLSDSVLVVLTAQPAGNVVLQVEPFDTQVTISTSSLTFTSANWDVPQEVVIIAEDDDFVDQSDTSRIQVKVDPAQSVATFADAPAQSVLVTVEDNEVAGFTVTATGGSTIVDENTPTVSDTWTVKLDAEPAGPVVINLEGIREDLDQLLISESFLVFLPSNWNQPQTISFFARDDVDAEGDLDVNIVVRVSPSGADAGYANVAAQTQTVTVIDNDFVRINVSGVSADLAEGETSRDFQVQLAAEPSSDVVIVISTSDTAQLTTSQTELTFTPANWQASQVFNITAADDERIDGTYDGVVSVAVDPDRSDNQFDSAPVHEIAVTAADNDREQALDIDGNGLAASLSDGILIVRYLAGFRGDALVSRAVDSTGPRIDPDAVVQWMDDARDMMMDVDDDGDTLPLTDGILTIRYLANFGGDSLIANAVSNKGKRKDPVAIRTFLDQFNPDAAAGPIARGPSPGTVGYQPTVVGFENDQLEAVTDSVRQLSTIVDARGDAAWAYATPSRSAVASRAAVNLGEANSQSTTRSDELTEIDTAFSDAIGLEF